MDRGGDGVERRGRAQAKKASPRGGGQALGRGVGQGRQGGGLAEDPAAARLQGVGSQKGGGAYLLLARTKPQDEQGLRAFAAELGGIHLRDDDAPYGEEAGPCLRIIRQFLEGEFSEVGHTQRAKDHSFWGCSKPHLSAPCLHEMGYGLHARGCRSERRESFMSEENKTRAQRAGEITSPDDLDLIEEVCAPTWSGTNPTKMSAALRKVSGTSRTLQQVLPLILWPRHLPMAPYPANRP